MYLSSKYLDALWEDVKARKAKMASRIELEGRPLDQIRFKPTVGFLADTRASSASSLCLYQVLNVIERTLFV